MRSRVVEVSSGDALYKDVLNSSEHALFNHSERYQEFLRRLMPGCEHSCLVAMEDDAPVAALPLMVRQGPFGPVANSLPFYGSHGGIISTEQASEASRRALVDAFHQRNAAMGVSWATLITNPLAPDNVVSDRPPSYRDERIGQFTPLPSGASRAEVEESLLAQCHQKTRNLIRKGLKAGYRISHDPSREAMEELAALHLENMSAIGGLAKSKGVFQAIRDVFEYDVDYRVYRAETVDGECASLMLVFYFKGFVEYFTPCVAEQHRSGQPLSALILTAMADAAIERGSEWWNWGGTWLSQDGVYHFKSRWGTQDRRYEYLVWAYQNAPALDKLDRSVLAREYPLFYTLPYQLLGER